MAQELAIPAVAYPRLPGQAASVEGFVPQGWILEAQASGDLNRDGHADLAFVLRQNDPKNIVENSGHGENPFNTNPRILAVAFRNGPAGDYVLHVENRTLIPRPTIPTADDPLGTQGVKIERGGLRVQLSWWMSVGGWETFTATHIFQYRNSRFELIGYDRYDTHRGSGDTRETSVNYLTGKMKITTGNIARDATKVTWRALPRRAPLTLDAMGDGLEFHPED